MAEQAIKGGELIDGDWADDPDLRARQIDALMSGPPADRPPITVVGDDAVFGVRPIQRSA